jgi:Na+/melibiose symporter-like transporter
LATALNGYFAIYCLGGEFWITPLSLAIAIPVLLASLFVPKLFVKHDKFKVYIITRLASILVNVVIYLTGYGNIVLLLSLIVIRQLFAAVWGISSIMFVADCVEYGQFITGARAQGVTFSLKAFTNKIVVALSGSLAMFGLAAYGFVSGAGAVQTPETVGGIW